MENEIKLQEMTIENGTKWKMKQNLKLILIKKKIKSSFSLLTDSNNSVNVNLVSN